MVLVLSFILMYCITLIDLQMLNSSGDNGHPCHVPDLSGKAFNFSPLRMIFAVGFSRWL